MYAEPTLISEQLRAIVARHGLGARSAARRPSTGIVNTIYQLGADLILRVPGEDEESVASTYTEALVVPAARRAGVATPAIVAFDDSLELLPVPHAIYERMEGVDLSSLDLEPHETAEAYCALGRDLARLHRYRVEAVPELAALRREDPFDPRLGVDRLAAEGYILPGNARWIRQWFDRLAPEALQPATLRVLHCDVHPGNLLVRPGTYEYVALLDWGDSCWADPALEFAFLPLHAAPFALQGYREIPGPQTEWVSEARIVWYHLDRALRKVQRPPRPGDLHSSAAPLARLLDLLRFFLESSDVAWRSAGPSPSNC